MILLYFMYLYLCYIVLSLLHGTVLWNSNIVFYDSYLTPRLSLDGTGKMFMRGTVLISDVMLLFPALLLMARALSIPQRGYSQLLFLAVLSPALILIDHGHFQYNGVR
jgi:hypothetical protein